MKNKTTKKNAIGGFIRTYREDKDVVAIGPFNLVIHPGVYRPENSKIAHMFYTSARFPGKSVLDLGCGCGGAGIHALHAGAKHCVFADFSKESVANAKENVKFHGVKDRSEVIRSDLFGNLKGRKFDVVMFNAPFVYTEDDHDSLAKQHKTTPLITQAIYDSNYSLMERFISGVGKHLKPNGIVQMSFGSIGNEKLFKQFLKTAGLKRKCIKKAVVEGFDDYTCYIYHLSKK